MSEISRLNANGGRSMGVSAETRQLVERAVEGGISPAAPSTRRLLRPGASVREPRELVGAGLTK